MGAQTPVACGITREKGKVGSPNHGKMSKRNESLLDKTEEWDWNE